MQCARSAKFCMSVNIRTLVLVHFEKDFFLSGIFYKPPPPKCIPPPIFIPPQYLYPPRLIGRSAKISTPFSPAQGNTTRTNPEYNLNTTAMVTHLKKAFFPSTFHFSFSGIISGLHVISIMNICTISVIATVHIITVGLLPTVTFLVLLRTCLRKVIRKPINHRVYLMQFKIGF